MTSINYPVRNKMLRLKRDCTPNAYQRGFEDCRYLHRYMNQFPPGSAEWWQYEFGNRDACKTARAERI